MQPTTTIDGSLKPRTRSRFGRAFVGLLIASSSFVLFEPAPYDVLAGILLAVFLVAGLKVPRAIFLPGLLVSIFAAANLISFYFAKDYERALFFQAVTIYMLLTWFLITCLVYEDPQRILPVIWKGYVFAAILAASLGILGYFHLVPNSDLFLGSGRAKGLFKDPNVYGPFLVPVALYLISRFEANRSRAALINYALFTLLIVGILLSFSRAAWGNAIVSTLIFFTLRAMTSPTPGKFVRTLIIGAGVFIIGGGILAMLISSSEVGELFLKRAQFFQNYDVAAGGRFAAQLQALQAAFASPFGIGPGQSELQFVRATHSLYVRILSENGIIGSLAFGTLLIVTCVKGLRFCKRETPVQIHAIIVLSALIGTLMNSLVIDSLHWRHFFLLLGLMWGMMTAYEVSSKTVKRPI